MKTKNTKRKEEKISPMMRKLYGSSFAAEVWQRLEELDPELNQLIQEIAYSRFWNRPELNIRDKSLVTVAALIALGKEEQTKIHMRGFLNTGGSINELRNTLLHLAIYCGFPATMNGFSALKDITREFTNAKRRQ